MTHKRILVVEDDTTLAMVLRDNLEFSGFEVQCAPDGGSALVQMRDFNPDLVILDIMLPDASGFDLCKALHLKGQAVIVLTALHQKADKLRGLTLGADDYITKPFDLDELLARIHVVLRRTTVTVDRLVLGRVNIEFTSHAATRNGRPLNLTRREFELLKYLAVSNSRIVYRDELLRAVWGYPDDPLTRSVDHAIARLRKKIERDPHHPRFIHTVRGDGYFLTWDTREP